MLTQELLRSILDYDPDTGILIWRTRNDLGLYYNDRWNSRWAGKVAGSPHSRGYIAVTIDGVKYLAHRLIWLYVYGYMPIGVDHWDNNPANNRLKNLRDSTQSQNLANSRDLNKGLECHGNKVRARITINRTRIELGSYETWDEAQTAYIEAAEKYFGEFARHNRV